MVSVILMALHKVESYIAGEWNFAPAYQYIIHLGLGNGQMVFLTFVTTLMAGLICVATIISWRSGIWFFFAFWGLTFLLELHHVVRTLGGSHYYPGLYSAIIYVAFGIFYWITLVKLLTHSKLK